MITTSFSFISIDSIYPTRVINGPVVSNVEFIKQLLIQNFNSVELANLLIDGGDVVELGDSVDNTVYGNNPPKIIEHLDSNESQLIISNINFVYLENKWTFREDNLDIGGFQHIN